MAVLASALQTIAIAAVLTAVLPIRLRWLLLLGALLDVALVIAEYSEPAYLEGITDQPAQAVITKLVVLPCLCWLAGVAVGAAARLLLPYQQPRARPFVT